MVALEFASVTFAVMGIFECAAKLWPPVGLVILTAGSISLTVICTGAEKVD